MRIKTVVLSLVLGLVAYLLLFFMALGLKFYWYTEVKGYELTLPRGGDGHVTRYLYAVSGSDVAETFKCEFDKPLKHVTLINHWFDTNEELMVEYLLSRGPDDPEEVWGWSSCLHQPDDNWAACDIYAVVPTYVHADMNMDTVGHESMHGACGDFHG